MGQIPSLKQGSFSIHFTITGAENIVRYGADFVIWRLYKGSLYQGSTVFKRSRR